MNLFIFNNSKKIQKIPPKKDIFVDKTAFTLHQEFLQKKIFCPKKVYEQWSLWPHVDTSCKVFFAKNSSSLIGTQVQL